MYGRGDRLISLDNSEFESIYNRNIETVYRICYMYMKNKTDAEDMTQNTFIKYLKYNPTFENNEHEKAWFIVTATNSCKNHFKTWWNRNTYLDNEFEVATTDKNDDTLSHVLNLPTKYKQVIYMYYYEGYSTVEIAKLLNTKESTIRTHLLKGRQILKEKIGSEQDEN